jgi:Tfp pilus assembly PilM family ATPase
MKTLGLEVDGKIINFALLSKKKEILELCSSECSNVKQLYNENQNLVTNTTIVSALDANKVIIKQKTLKMTKKSSLEKALPFQTEISSSLNKDKTIVFPLIEKKHATSTDLLFYITTKKALQEHLDLLLEMNVDPDYVSTKASALVSFASHHFPDKQNLCLLHIGTFQTTIVQMEAGKAKSSHFIKIGYNDLLKEYQNKFDKTATCIDCYKMSTSEQCPVFKSFSDELSRSLFSFYEKSKSSKNVLFLSGQIQNLKKIEEFIFFKNSNYLSSSIEIDNPMQLPYAVCIGLSLEAIKDDHSIQFRQNEFIPLHHLKKVGNFFLSLFFCVLASSFLILALGNSFINHKNKIIKKNISLIEKKEQINLLALSKDQLKTTLESLERKIESEARNFPYYVKYPKLSSVFEWIYKNEFLKNKNDQLLEITRLSYTLEKEKNRNISKFIDCKVSMEFKCPSPEIAEKFYNGLLKGDHLVDSKKEIGWSVEKNIYKTSFYLKELKNKDAYDK